MYVCMYVCMYIYIYAYIHTNMYSVESDKWVYKCRCIYIYLYIYIYEYIYSRTRTHTYRCKIWEMWMGRFKGLIHSSTFIVVVVLYVLHITNTCIYKNIRIHTHTKHTLPPYIYVYIRTHIHVQMHRERQTWRVEWCVCMCMCVRDSRFSRIHAEGGGLSCRSFCAKEPLIIELFCGKWGG